MRIATWNVERPKPRGWKIPPAQLRRMAEVDADIWVLTETHLSHAPSDEHRSSAFSPPHPERRPTHERWTAIWSRWPLVVVEDPPPHRRGTVAAIVEAPGGPVLIYGTVIAWANEPHHDDGTPARQWEVHLGEIERQGREWMRLREAYPDVPLIVAGDFNQDRDGSGWYGTKATRAALTSALANAGLECVTEMDAVATGLLAAHHLVDHICVPAGMPDSVSVSAWENADDSGQRLSDHPTIAVDFTDG
jgi:endonuclease/exonuclease/phosphatase family metal-dependent hydrolase